MSAARAPDAARLHGELEAVWGNPRGLRAAAAVNHTAVALRYLWTGLGFFLFGGLLAMLIRAQLARPGAGFLTPEAYAQVFTMHGSVMMFLFAVPVMEGLAAYLLPKMLGARDLAFPRLSAFGYWCYLFGGLILAASFLVGVAPDGGWFMYAPLSSRPHSPGPNADVWLLATTLTEISAVAAGVELVVSILRTRAAGMSLDRMPVYAWYILVMALMIVVGFPPLIAGNILLELERSLGLPFFDVARGGDPVLWQHLFWLFGHPEVYIIFLPAAGIVSTLLPVFAQRPLVGYRAVVLAAIATGFLSFGLWVHHMFTVGIPQLAQAFFSAASMLVAVPTGVQVFAWIATLWLGRPVWHVPMLWLSGFLAIFVGGGLTGVMLALVPFDWQVHDTQFVVAHLHYVLVGGMLFPLVAGLYYWLPHFSGRMPSPTLGRWGFWLVFVGFNLGFLVMHWTGLLGMPRRVHAYEAGLGWEWPNLTSSIGAFVMAIGVATVLADLVLHWRFGSRAPPNPWRADTLEWATATPPASYNFASLPRVASRHPLWDEPALADALADGRHGLGTASHGRRETWGTDPMTGEPREIVHLPSNSWLPLVVAALLAAACVALLAKQPAAAAFAALGAAAATLRWSWLNGLRGLAGLDGRTRPGEPPLHFRSFDGPGRWGMRTTLLADAALYLSLLFSWAYLWVVAPRWSAPPEGTPGAGLLLAAALASTAAAGWTARLVRRLRAGGEGGLAGGFAGAAVLATLQAGLVLAAFAGGLAPAISAHDATVAVLLGYQLFHAAAGAAIAASQALRARLGHVGVAAPYEPGVAADWLVYSAGAAWIGWAALALFPLAWRGA